MHVALFQHGLSVVETTRVLIVSLVLLLAFVTSASESKRHAAIGVSVASEGEHEESLRVVLSHRGDVAAPLPKDWKRAFEAEGLPPIRRIIPEELPAPDPADETARALPWLVAVVDDGGVVRRAERLPGDASGDRVAHVAREWATGRLLYDVHCMRCHGADGSDTSYSHIIPLNGMGETRTVEEILEASRSTGISGISRLDDEDEWAIAVFIAGL